MTTAVSAWAPDPTLDDGPAMAHLFRLPRENLIALCGARLLGQTVPPTYPNICEECWRIRCEENGWDPTGGVA